VGASLLAASNASSGVEAKNAFSVTTSMARNSPECFASYAILREATEPEPKENEAQEKPEKNPAAVALGRLGGKKGGPARAIKLSKKRRRDIAKKAADARWRKKRESEK
jgi:hypothetical protein